MNELVIGNVDGVLSIFRGVVDTKPWRKYSDLGMVCNVRTTFQWMESLNNGLLGIGHTLVHY